MFGDDFKKSLEPIHASDELLAKTRLAIEQARREQAAVTINQSKKSSGSFKTFWKIAVPIACVALLVGGMALVLPKLIPGNKDNNVAFHTTMVYTTTCADVDYAENTVVYEASQAQADVAETTTSYSESTSAASKSAKQFAAQQYLESNQTEADEVYDPTSTRVGDYLLSVSSDSKFIMIYDATTDKLVPNTLDRFAPSIDDLPEDRYIILISYDESSELLFIYTADTTDITTCSVVDFYYCDYSGENFLCCDATYLDSIDYNNDST